MAYYKDLRIENEVGCTLDVIVNKSKKIELIYNQNNVFTFDSTIDAEALIDELKEMITIIDRSPF